LLAISQGRISMRQKITKRAVDGAELAARDLFLWDTEVSGFGLKVTPSGNRIYILQYRFGGRVRRYTIGRHGSPWTPEQARGETVRLLGLVAGGSDPGEARQEQTADPTFAEFADRYLREHAELHKKKRSIELDRYLLRSYLLPALGSKKLGKIGRPDIARMHQGMARTPVIANRALTLTAAMFALAVRWGAAPEGTNPCLYVKKYREQSRERFLSEVELARLGDALAQVERSELSPPAAIAAIRLLILTGARKTEVLTLRWEYVDFERALLRLPDSKSGAKTIYLSAPALELLSSAPRRADNPNVLPGKKAGAHLVNVEKTWRRVRALAGLDDVRIHDLRHSFAAVGAGSGLGLPIIGALLGHTQASTTARYAHLAADPLRAANEAIGRRISTAMTLAKRL
jgi:integrase